MMKKVLLLIGLSLSLSACGNVTTQISNRNDAVFQVGNQRVTFGQLYTVMLASDPSAVVRDMALRIILDKEVEITPEMEARADVELDNFVDNVGQGLDMFLSYYGFKTIDEYRRDVILLGLQQEALVNRYIATNLTDLISRNRPMKVRILDISDADQAQAALDELRAGRAFDQVADRYGDGRFGGEEQLITTRTNLPFVVREFLNVQTAPTLSEVIAEVGNHYIVQVTVADPNRMLDEVQAAFEQDASFIELTIENYMLKYEFTLYDKPLFDNFRLQFPNYLQR
jgi:hypothetical protein